MMIVSSSTYLRIVIYFTLIQLMVVILMVASLMVEMALCTCVAQSRGHGQVAGAGVSWSLRSLPVHWPRLVTRAWV